MFGGGGGAFFFLRHHFESSTTCPAASCLGWTFAGDELTKMAEKHGVFAANKKNALPSLKLAYPDAPCREYLPTFGLNL